MMKGEERKVLKGIDREMKREKDAEIDDRELYVLPECEKDVI